MIPVIVPVYAAVLALLLVLLSFRVIRLRRAERIGMGHGDCPRLLRAVRVQANFTEYVPMALILLGCLEIQQFSGYLVHGLGLTLVVARLAHAVGMSRESEDFRFRVSGMAATFFVLSSSALLLIGAAIFPG